MKYAELAGIRVGENYPVRIMGVINASPESFFKGSVYASKGDIQRVARQMTDEGADILDIGARSTAPYLKTAISIEEETERLVRAVEAIKAVTDLPISADTKVAAVAAEARKAGATILNDVSGLAHDPAMGGVGKLYDGVILMANAEYCAITGKPVAVVKTALLAALERARQASIEKKKIVVDPGIGFFRDRQLSWDEWDRLILQHLPELQSLERPVMIGLSRKSFIGKVLDHQDAADRLYGSLGLTALSVDKGARLVRTHDVAATKDVVRIAEWLGQHHKSKSHA